MTFTTEERICGIRTLIKHVRRKNYGGTDSDRPGKNGWATAGIVSGAVAAVLLALWVFLFCVNRFALTVEIKGDAEVSIPYGQTYTDPGASAWFSGSILVRDGMVPEVEVVADGEVDTAAVGTYVITYTAKFHEWTATAQRKVHVVDELPPEITLISDPDHLTIYGDAYEEEGYRATDEYDGDITHLVKREEKDGIVIYTVFDSSGNQAQVIRTIQYHDPAPPEITLTGGENYTMYAGKHFEEPGFAATDNFDGDLSGQVVVTGEIDPYFPGTYTLEYSVTDSYDNTTTVSRTVTVVAHQRPETVYPGGKVIYLTFDDGPGAYTDQLLDILAKYDVKATFFVIDTGNYSTMKRIVNEGHAIGIHSVTHDYRQIYASMDAYFNDLYTMQQIIFEQTGVRTTLMRFPGGSSNTVSHFNKGIMSRLTKAVEYAGFQYFDWNVDSDDAGSANTWKEVYGNVTEGVSNRRISIVLQHDIKPATIDAIERIIQWALKNGYTFLPLDPTSPAAHHGVNN